MKLFNRDSIARDIQFQLFNNKTVWELILLNPRERMQFVTAGHYSHKRIYDMMYYNVKKRCNALGGELKSIYVNLNNKNKKLNYKNAKEFMGEVMSKHLPITFKIMIKNKYYEFTVGH